MKRTVIGQSEKRKEVVSYKMSQRFCARIMYINKKALAAYFKTWPKQSGHFSYLKNEHHQKRSTKPVLESSEQLGQP
jgi:hypothetical protein